MIASNTKGMSTLLLAKLVDEGKIEWTQPVEQVYPAFRLGSRETSAKVEVKHLVCACTGLPRKDMEWLFNTSPQTPATDTFSQLAATEPTSKFGEVFQYNNLMAAAAGYLGGHLVHPELELGQAYDRAMQEKVFGPLGMTATTFDYDKAMSKDWAEPNAVGIDGQPTALGVSGLALNLSIRPFRPAGGAWSTANDLIKYVRFELNEGRLDDGTQYVSTRNLLQRRVPNVPVGEDRTYGMGLQVDRDYGVDVVHHGGSMGGYKSDIMLVPSADIGAVILTNANSGRMLLRPFMRRLLELLYDGKPEAAEDVAASAARNRAELADERARVSVIPDAAAVEALASEYASRELGQLKVTHDRNHVSFKFRTLASSMGTRKNDDGTISFVSVDPTLLYFPLVVSTEGGKPALIVRDGQHEYKFVATQ
jgi:CubicO group peptidase (beta-lactamase class C family)